MKITDIFHKKVLPSVSQDDPHKEVLPSVSQDDLHKENTLQVASSVGNLFKQGPYYDEAEPYMDDHWEHLIWPLIHDADFSSVIDLAAGHGRNSRKLLEHARSLTIVDINQECIDYCMTRFQGESRIHYFKTDGISLQGIDDDSISLIYSYDSMVHFDSDVIKEYMYEFYRVLKSGGRCFCHHSNYVGNPTGDFIESPHVRNFMSKELFAHYAAKAGLKVIKQQVINWADVAALDCLSLLTKG